jgi:4-hydroxybenzoate polyprenyltransferase/phosphoserine phosphatase
VKSTPAITGQLSEQPALIVDLDGTLVRTDTLIECILAAINHPLKLSQGLLALRFGKAAMKQQIAAVADLKPTLLPYNEKLLSLLRVEAASGRSLILATGADRKIASAVADHLGIFDAVLASDGNLNLTGATKLKAIRQMVGDRPFTYIGNDRKDLPIWREARSGIVVNAPAFVEREAGKATNIEAATVARTSCLKGLLQAIRPYQWSKNLLVFVPIITARAVDDLAAWGSAIFMFLAFSAAASGMYLANDLLDLAADRQHSRKRSRPFASGALPLHVGLIASPLLLLAGFGLGAATGTLPVVLLYVFASIGYSLYLKSQPIVDVFLLAALYTVRLFGGGIATGYHVTLWLLAFSSFLFLSLGIVKRVSELMTLSSQDGGRAAGRGYRPNDTGILQLIGVASSFASSIVLAFYIQSGPGAGLDTSPTFPTLIWALVPLILFWQCRIWLSTARGRMHDDPIIFAARDWVSWLVAICCLVVFLLGDRIDL